MAVSLLHRFGMPRPFSWRLSGPGLAMLAVLTAFGAGPANCAPLSARLGPVGSGACRIGVIEGEVRAGEAFESPMGNGLKILLEPIASGWAVRVLAAKEPRGPHDYAELATPPYRSVSPLLLSTDFSFRAQDALAWNPRRFHFAADRRAFGRLQTLYEEYQRTAKDPAAHRAIETRLVAEAAQAPAAELTLLDAHLVQGTADQTGAAALVASHLNASAHEIDQPADGRATPLGRLNAVRFRLRFELPKGFEAAPGSRIERGKCME